MSYLYWTIGVLAVVAVIFVTGSLWGSRKGIAKGETLRKALGNEIDDLSRENATLRAQGARARAELKAQGMSDDDLWDTIGAPPPDGEQH